MFHARGPAAAKDRSPSDDVVRGTATELDAADLRPGLTVAAADTCMNLQEVRQVRWRVAVQAAMYHHTQLVLDALFDWHIYPDSD